MIRGRLTDRVDHRAQLLRGLAAEDAGEAVTAYQAI
jgi:hypothetical protein